VATWNGEQGLSRDWAICQAVIHFAALADVRPPVGFSKIAGIALEEVTSLLSRPPASVFPSSLSTRIANKKDTHLPNGCILCSKRIAWHPSGGLYYRG